MLELRITRSDRVIVVACTGRIVFGEETTTLCRTVRDLLTEQAQIALNLQGVDHVDSGGLGALVGLVLSARRTGGDVKLCNVVPRVRELLRITGLATAIDVCSSEETAVSAFRLRAAVA